MAWDGPSQLFGVARLCERRCDARDGPRRLVGVARLCERRCDAIFSMPFGVDPCSFYPPTSGYFRMAEIVKLMYSAFRGTYLKNKLRRKGRSKVLIAGKHRISSIACLCLFGLFSAMERGEIGWGGGGSGVFCHLPFR